MIISVSKFLCSAFPPVLYMNIYIYFNIYFQYLDLLPAVTTVITCCRDTHTSHFVSTYDKMYKKLLV